MDAYEALRELFPDTYIDMTTEGYHEALRKMREKDPAMAKRIERAVRIPVMRKKPWTECSLGLKARVKLLPYNPFFKQDVILIRDILGFPETELSVKDNDNILCDLLKRKFDKNSAISIAERNLADNWLYLHGKEAQSLNFDDSFTGNLTKAMKQLATQAAHIDFSQEEVPDWLNYKIPPQEHGKELITPIGFAVTLLIKRHNLPLTLKKPIINYVLTNNIKRLTDLEYMEVSFTSDLSEDPEAFTVHIKKIDEWVTREDWERIWGKYIAPRQERILERRGRPQRTGRQVVDINKLLSYMPLYEEMINNDLNFAELSERPLPLTYEDKDNETVRDAFNKIEILFKPRE